MGEADDEARAGVWLRYAAAGAATFRLNIAMRLAAAIAVRERALVLLLVARTLLAGPLLLW